jgi:hypothetical protein
VTQPVPAIKSFKNSLRWALYREIGFDALHAVKVKVYAIEAETECLVSIGEDIPEVLDLLFDLEVSPGEWERLWFELHLIKLTHDKHGCEVARYNAFCDC